MAGYIMTLSGVEVLEECFRCGIYSTNMHREKEKNVWNIPQEGTFADYFTMKHGDHIYFFVKRKIYGIGILSNIGDDCKYLSFTEADSSHMPNDEEYSTRNPLLNNLNKDNRCFCIFRPDPQFFQKGIDMDEVLNSNPSMFRMLRVMWKVSFIKIGDAEDKALQDILLKRNEENIESEHDVFEFSEAIQTGLPGDLTSYAFTYKNIIRQVAEDDGRVKHEMALEAAICDILTHRNDTIFGKWDYISHQVVASPFKPVDYMDKMDIFGYRYIEGYHTKSKYVIIELKRNGADSDVLLQVMKYVDWVKEEYAHGDYSMIEAYIVAFDFAEDMYRKRDKWCVRNYMKGFRPSEPTEWSSVRLIRYKFDKGLDDLTFEDVTHAFIDE